MSLDKMFDDAKQFKAAEELVDLLKQTICTVVFTKKDGTERVMRCTLLENHVKPYEKKTDKVKQPNPNVVHAWDIESNGWRSFNFDSVKEVHY